MPKDLAALVDVTDADGLLRLAKSLTNSGGGRFGFRYELEVAAKLVRDGGVNSVEFIERWVDNAAGKTDIDLIVNGVYYQVKRSGDAFKKGARGIVEWVDKVRAEDATIIRYVTPDGSKIPGAALKQIDEYASVHQIDIAVEHIPFK